MLVSCIVIADCLDMDMVTFYLCLIMYILSKEIFTFILIPLASFSIFLR